MDSITDIFDFSHESTVDVTGQFFILESSDLEPEFQATVPDHLTEQSLAHWDDAVIW